MKSWKRLRWAICVLALFCMPYLPVQAGQKQTIYNSPYVSFTQDGKAWTTNAGEQNFEFYPHGTTVRTGILSSLRSLEIGEHFYRTARTGEVPIGKWRVDLQKAICIHEAYPALEDPYHGISFGRSYCFKPYYSGWQGYCADCGEELTGKLTYMSREAAESIDYLDMGVGLDYYYLCPHCSNMEQGVPVGEHMCKAISWNAYLVQYHKNTSDLCGGDMPSSMHMYNNEKEYEGEPVTPITHLTMNNYTRTGYEFVGWNTKQDGSGIFYEDGAEIFNLTDKDIRHDGDEAIVILYAQWRPSQSTLLIDPNGGSYGGEAGELAVVKKYGEQFLLNTKSVTAPDGYTVSFQTCGGAKLPSIIGKCHFVEWEREQPFLGKMIAQKDAGMKYIFCAPDGSTDRVSAAYELDPIVLPGAVKTGASFGGWYYDAAFTRPAGGAGDQITPTQDLTLYANWVELVLVAKDNYSANGSKGAVDLSWSQSDGKNKVYRVYQGRDITHWTKINDAGDIGDSRSVNENFGYSGGTGRYIVPYTGMYILTAEGAQGGNYGAYSGGYGGRASAKVWLQKGEVLSFCIGGQNGYNGGGTANAYGAGGGYSSVSSDKKGMLLIAGGGGGASPGGNGGAGGSAASVIAGNVGQSGMAGGGGGYQGGTAGKQVLHHHVKGICPYHVHTGNAHEGGGCYQKQVEATGVCTYVDKGNRTDHACGTVYCKTCKGYSLGTNHCHWYGHSSCGGSDGHKGYKTCSKGHVVQRWGSFMTGTHTYTITAYELSCGMQEGWNCQYEEGQVIASEPAYGGSNYVNGSHAYSQTSLAGVRAGNGLLTIRSEAIGFVDAISLSGVTATDYAPPRQIKTVTREPMSANQIEICWEEPEDTGTAYYHYVESCLKGSSNPLCRSNIEKNVLTSGIKGYYLLVNTEPGTVVTVRNGAYQEKRHKVVTLGSQEQYLHIAAVDVAGNIGATRHISFGDNEDMIWKLYTRPLEIEDGYNVHPAREKNTYYVRSDGSSPFQLKTDSYMDGNATEAYQINYSVYESASDASGTWKYGGRNVIKTQSEAIRDGEIRTEASKLSYSTEETPYMSLYPYSYTVRKNRNRNLTSVQKFTLDAEASGKRIKIIPMAGADRNGEVVWSNRQKDEVNGIVLIGDCEAPTIRGLEVLADKELINRPDGTVVLDISAEDDLSGVGELYVKITNTDNRVEELYTPNEYGRIHIDITRDKPIFSGDFIVTVHAADNVGNKCELTTGTTEFALSTSVERMLEPHDPIFKCGESGILTITTWGYAERVEVEFPPEMVTLHPELNRVFDYTQIPEPVREEKIQFMVPLDTPENEKYTITVRAYKGDKRLEEHPSLSTVAVEGSILDELRTRLR